MQEISAERNTPRIDRVDVCFLSAVQVSINLRRNWLNLSAQFLLNTEKVIAVLVCDEINSQTQMAKSAGATNSMQVSLGSLREVKINNHVNGLDIDSSGE
jgi:hypothetical protein